MSKRGGSFTSFVPCYTLHAECSRQLALEEAFAESVDRVSALTEQADRINELIEDTQDNPIPVDDDDRGAVVICLDTVRATRHAIAIIQRK